jgi:hypothetical protein
MGRDARARLYLLCCGDLLSKGAQRGVESSQGLSVRDVSSEPSGRMTTISP